ncbi:AlpA family transcriptional regulator [Paraburkholderia sp. BL6665CI2N2]|uniref:helix-turn-helix transcriptional regulator n=1 Tax=Paraburkholderia sp. BL6665CI2N2 TaxID=1938806 RepID=UPI001064D28A|nr:helix-turn-helix domain-containing protein [Paraburkholderia sp. BL6665CI2N2]TDY25761.1 AlpA family transcriptional regulator [Paraburkholderia sp. BL6665CI2N2]
MNDSILRPREVAERLGVKKDCLYKWVRKGLLAPPIKITSRTTGWRASYIEAFISERESKVAA